VPAQSRRGVAGNEDAPKIDRTSRNEDALASGRVNLNRVDHGAGSDTHQREARQGGPTPSGARQAAVLDAQVAKRAARVLDYAPPIRQTVHRREFYRTTGTRSVVQQGGPVETEPSPAPRRLGGGIAREHDRLQPRPYRPQPASDPDRQRAPRRDIALDLRPRLDRERHRIGHDHRPVQLVDGIVEKGAICRNRVRDHRTRGGRWRRDPARNQLTNHRLIDPDYLV